MAPPTETRGPVRQRWLLLGLIGIGGIAASALSSWREDHALFINASESLPNWAFTIDRGRTPKRGDYLFFVPPGNALVRAHFGENPGAFGKIVYGMAGDTIEHRGAEVLVNGRLVGTMKQVTRRGEKLTPGPIGTVPDGCYFVGTPHPDSFDSRYGEIGFICGPQILGTGEAVL